MTKTIPRTQDPKIEIVIPIPVIAKLKQNDFGFEPFQQSLNAIRGCSKFPREKISRT
jgi:hypothetical protein